jgi:hypothetical protein
LPVWIGIALGLAAPLHRDLSNGETDLDTGLDDLQRWMLLPAARRILLSGRCSKAGSGRSSHSVVIGMNSIAIYVLVHLIDGFVIESFKVHFGRGDLQPCLVRETRPC